MATNTPLGWADVLTDWALIGELRQKHCAQQRWERFYAIYQRIIRNLALKSNLDYHAAEDVVQETMRSVCRNICKFDPDPARGSFRGWLLRLARWRIYDQLRKRWKDRILVPLSDLDCPGVTDAGQRLADVAFLSKPEDDWRKELFWAAVERIKPKVNPAHFQIFDLYVLRAMPASEVSTLLGISTHSVHQARNRVLNRIKNEIQGLLKRP